jgi:hypothetical protein
MVVGSAVERVNSSSTCCSDPLVIDIRKTSCRLFSMLWSMGLPEDLSHHSQIRT